MNFCPNCGRQLKDGEVCNCQSNSVFNAEVVPENNTYSTSNGKIFSILSYIGILWIVGLLVDPEKNDPKVRFHIGQGMILFIVDVILGMVNGLIGVITPSFLGFIVTLLNMSLAVLILFLSVIGIINAIHCDEKELPVIGRFAFFK